MFLKLNGSSNNNNSLQANGTKSKKALAVEQKNSSTSVNGNTKSNIPPLASTVPKTTQPAKNQQQQQQQTPAVKTEPEQPTTSQPSTAQNSQNGPSAMQQTALDPKKLIPIQITLPPQPNEVENRVLTIKVPALAIQEKQLLPQLITSEIITSIMPLQPSVASAVLQQHVTSVLNSMYGESKFQQSFIFN